MRVVITGASGYVGQFIADQLARAEHEVIALTRVPLFVPKIDGKIEWAYADLSDPVTLTEPLNAADALVHAALSHIEGRYRGGEGDDPAEFWRTNLEGTLALFDAAKRHRISRTVFISSRAVFGDVDPTNEIKKPVSDKQLPFPTTHYGILKATIENLTHVYPEIGLCSLRPTGVYGVPPDHQKPKWSEIMDKGVSPESLSNQARTEVFGGDVALAVELLLRTNRCDVVGRSFNCSDVAISTEQIYELVRRIKDQPSDLNVEQVLAEPLPPSGEPELPMRCDGLNALGWRPGGLARVVRELYQLTQR